MGLLYRVTAVITIYLSLGVAFGQTDCYRIDRSDTGCDHVLYSDELEVKACEAATELGEVGGADFEIIGNSYYRLLDDESGFTSVEDVHAWSVGKARRTYPGGYLLVAKIMDADNETIRYLADMMLPESGLLADLTTVERTAIEHAIERHFTMATLEEEVHVSDNARIEAEALTILADYARAVREGTLDIANLFELADFDRIPIAPGADMVGDKEEALNGLEGNGYFTGYDYAGLRYRHSPGGKEVRVAELLVSSPSGSQVDVLAAKFGVTTAYVVSSDEVNDLEVVQRTVDDYLLKNDFVFWFHYSAAENALYLKVSANLGYEKAQEIFDYYFLKDMNRFRPDLFPDPDDEPSYALQIQGDCKTFSPRYGKTCLLGEYSNVFDPNILPPFNLGIAAGMLDGLLGLLYFAYETGASLLDTARSFWNSAWSYLGKLRETYVRTESWLAVAETIGNDSREVLKSALKSAAEAYALVTAFVGTAAANWRPILQGIAQGITDWLKEIISDAALAGYFVGQLAFEILSDAATGGGAAAGKLFARASKWLGKINKPSFDLPGQIADMLGTAARRPAVAARVAKCKLLGAGCFLAGTNVLLAAGPVAIETVRPLDYVVASSEIVERVAEVGLVDGFVSAQQRERDRAVAQSDDLYVVTFVTGDGASSAELVLDRRWMAVNDVHTIGQTYHLLLPEQGFRGATTITDIRRFKPAKVCAPEDDALPDGYTYRRVTGRFTHTSDRVLELVLADGDTLGVTEWHPVFSEDHGDWRLATELTAGERVRTLGGGTTKVISARRMPGSHRVYNLEVRELHNFLVGASGVVVHNACSRGQLERFFDSGERFANLANAKIADAVEELRKLRGRDRTRYDQFTRDFGEEKIPLEEIGGAGGVRAWETLIDFPVLRKVPSNLEDVTKFVAKNRGSEAAIRQGLRDVGQYTDDFMVGLKNATEDLSHLGGRSALPDEIADAVNKIKDHRSSVGNPSSGNYGYLEGNVGSTSFGGHDLVRSGAPDNIPEVFEAVNVGPNGGWLRTTDSEYKMLNRFANDFGATRGSVYPNASGVLKIVSERPYCPSCKGVIQQFNQMFPNVQLILVDGVRG